MKLLFPLLLTLLLKLPMGGPPAVRVTFSPLTKAAYLAAKKTCVLTKPKMTFPLKKVRGRIVIPTAKGNVVLKDNPVAEENPEWEVYNYKGYSPELESHLIEHNHYEWSGDILLDKSGRQTETYSEPVYSPNFRMFAAISAGIEDAMFANSIRLFRLENHHWREVWVMEPSTDPATWEPNDICWLSNSTLLLKKRMWTGKNPGSTFAYARLTLR